MPVADYNVHNKDTLHGALAALRRIIFHREQQHTTWPDEANLALGQFADLIREVLDYREQALAAVELTPLGESIVAAAGTGGTGFQPVSGSSCLDRGTGLQPVSGSSGFQPESDPGDETDDEIPFGTPESRPGSGPLPLSVPEQHNLLRTDARRQSALRSIQSVCTLLTEEDNFGIDAAVQFAYAMKEVAEQALTYTGELPTVANPRKD